MLLRDVCLFFLFIGLGNVAKADTQIANLYFQKEKVKKIYYVLAAPQGTGQSSFGHAYLRIGYEDQPSLTDSVIEFVMKGQPSSFFEYLRAIGVGESTDRAVTVVTYEQVLREMIFYSQRDLTSYELLLSKKQRDAIVIQLNEIVQTKTYGKYNFFNNNCATAVRDIMTAADINMDGGISALIPSALPELLQESHLIGQIFVDDSLPLRRSKHFEKYRINLRNVLLLNEVEFEALRLDLISEQMDRRVLGYVRLLKGNSTVLSKLLNYLIGFEYLENRILRSELRSARLGKRNLDSSILINVDVSPENQTPQRSLRITEQHLESDDQGQFWLYYQVSFYGSDLSGSKVRESKQNLRIPIRSLSANTNGELLWRDDLGKTITVGIQSNSYALKSMILLYGLNFIPSISRKNRTTWTVSTYALIEVTPEQKNQSELTDLKWMIPLKNNDPLRPSCAAYVELQKALLERVIFDPSSARLREADSLKLINKLYNGEIIIVPGFSNTADWFSSLNSTAVREVIYQEHLRNFVDIQGAIENWWKGQSLGVEAVLELGKMARWGHYSFVYQHIEGSIGHAYLILDVQDLGANLKLVVYDPNLGLVKDLFTFDKATEKVHSAIYPSNTLFFRPFDLAKDVIQKSLLSPAMTQLAIRTSQLSGSHEVSLLELLNIY